MIQVTDFRNARYTSLDKSTVDLEILTEKYGWLPTTVHMSSLDTEDHVIVIKQWITQNDSLISPYVPEDLATTLKKTKDNKIKELYSLCEKTITNGFTSTALGSLHTYQGERDDQLNLLGVKEAGVDTLFKCFDGTVWSYKLHTISQINTVFTDGVAYKMSQLTRLDALKQQVNDAVDVASVDSIVW